MAHAPPGHHSVIGRPSAGGLHFTEYVVYRGEQSYPEYLITYQIVKPDDSVDDRWWMPTVGTTPTQTITHQSSSTSSLTRSLSSNSFASIDTNQTLLNYCSNNNYQNNSNNNHNHNNHDNNKIVQYTDPFNNSKFMIITPVVSIDRNFDAEPTHPQFDSKNIDDDSYYFAGNYFQMNILNNNYCYYDSESSSESSFQMNFYRSRHNLLTKTTNSFYSSAGSSWRWCTLLCAAIRCFRLTSRNDEYSTSFKRFGQKSYAGSRSNGKYEQFSVPRKTRDHLNNIMYELWPAFSISSLQY